MNKKSLMKVFLFAVFSTLLLSEGCSIKKNYLNLTNPSDFDRSDELVVLKRSVLERKLGNIPEGKYITLQEEDGSPLIIQFDDLNKDGKWDEAAFLYSFTAHQKGSLTAAVADKITAKAVVRAHVRQRRKNSDDTFGPDLEKDSIPAGQLNTDFSKYPLPPFLTEGPAWENDKVGFRIYFDVRNTKDIWGKTTSKMMMDTVGVDPKVIYHHLAGWGMDILAVGESLGAGSLALSVPVNGKDTLVRLGGVNMGPVYYEKVADGPVRAIFRMHYPQWKVLD